MGKKEADRLGDDPLLAKNLTFEISLFSSNCFISLFACAIAGAFALAIFTVALFAFAVAAAAVTVAVQQTTCPGNDAVTVGGDNVYDTGDGSQSNNDLGNNLKSFHNESLH